MYGWVGKILRVDLTERRISEEPTEQYVEDYLGGRGIGARVWCTDNYTPGTDALDPGNPLIFNMGPLTGAAIPSSGRTDVTAVSPMGNLRGKSNFGGFWGPEAKYAGFDHIVITGKSDKPCYIWIKDGKVEIRSAEYPMGKGYLRDTEGDTGGTRRPRDQEHMYWAGRREARPFRVFDNRIWSGRR